MHESGISCLISIRNDNQNSCLPCFEKPMLPTIILFLLPMSPSLSTPCTPFCPFHFSQNLLGACHVALEQIHFKENINYELSWESFWVQRNQLCFVTRGKNIIRSKYLQPKYNVRSSSNSKTWGNETPLLPSILAYKKWTPPPIWNPQAY